MRAFKASVSSMCAMLEVGAAAARTAKAVIRTVKFGFILDLNCVVMIQLT